MTFANRVFTDNVSDCGSGIKAMPNVRCVACMRKQIVGELALVANIL